MTTQRQQILIGATSRVFSGVMIHRTMDKGGMSSMVHASQIELAANASLLFAPGGLHLMLMDPKRALRAGERVEINLEFRGGLVVPSEFEVRR